MPLPLPSEGPHFQRAHFRSQPHGPLCPKTWKADGPCSKPCVHAKVCLCARHSQPPIRCRHSAFRALPECDPSHVHHFQVQILEAQTFARDRPALAGRDKRMVLRITRHWPSILSSLGGSASFLFQEPPFLCRKWHRLTARWGAQRIPYGRVRADKQLYLVPINR